MTGHPVFYKNEQVDLKRWNDLLAEHQFASVFQSPEFYAFYNSIKGYSAQVVALEVNGIYEALCVITLQKEKGVKGFFSRRAIIYGGPLVNSEQNLKDLLKFIVETTKGQTIYTEIRNSFDYSGFKEVYARGHWSYVPYQNFELELLNSNIEALIAKMKYNRRREIRISADEGAVFEVAKNLQEVNELYTILDDLYKTRVKLPLPSLDYFHKLFQSPVGKVIVVKHEGKVIGGSFCLYLSGSNLYTLYYCGLRSWHKKIFPTHLAIVGAMQFGINENARALDFMGAGKKGEEYGVRKYKEEFGGTLVEHGRFVIVNKPLLYKLGTTALSIIQRNRK